MSEPTNPWDDFPPGGLHWSGATQQMLELLGGAKKAAEELQGASLNAVKAVHEVSESQRKLGGAMRMLRVKSRKSMRDVARFLNVSAPYLSDMERGNRAMSSETAKKILDYLCPKIK